MIIKDKWELIIYDSQNFVKKTLLTLSLSMAEGGMSQ